MIEAPRQTCRTCSHIADTPAPATARPGRPPDRQEAGTRTTTRSDAMSADPEAPADQADTPTTETPAQTDTSTGEDWQHKYQNLQPEFTRTTQQLAEERALWDDPDRLLARLGEKYPDWLADDDEPDNDDLEDTPAPTGQDPRVDEVAARLERIEAERATQQFEKDFQDAIGDRTVPKKGREWIEYQTFTNGNNPDALKNAVQAWFEDEELHPPAPKPERPRAPHVPAGGPPGEPPPPSTHQDRVQRALERINAEQA